MAYVPSPSLAPSKESAGGVRERLGQCTLNKLMLYTDVHLLGQILTAIDRGGSGACSWRLIRIEDSKGFGLWIRIHIIHIPSSRTRRVRPGAEGGRLGHGEAGNCYGGLTEQVSGTVKESLLAQ